ncbi:MAG: hypothetical protein AB7Q97_17920 [Gammaproteobacteria bacterium]
MSVTAQFTPSTAGIALKPHAEGPITRARLLRSRLLYLALCAAGLAPTLLDWSAGWRAAGWGLWLPGAGFLAVGGGATALFPVTLVLFAIAFFAWFGSGMIIAPVLVWAIAAAIAGAMAGPEIWLPATYVVPALALANLAHASWRRQRRYIEQLKRREERNAYLPGEIAGLRAVAVPAPAVRELDADQLGGLAYLLDRALQPVGELRGFDRIDQFQTSALRYQLNQIGYALAVAQCHYTPSFHGCLNLAQRRLIEQYMQDAIWGYWRLENAWGNLSLNGDPARRDNVMLTGYININVLLYMSNTGDRRYAEPGSLTFMLAGQPAYRHDVHTINQSLLDNFNGQAYCLFPCEPNWIYPACNFRGLTALSAYDHVFGTDHVAHLRERFRARLEQEFIHTDSGMVALRSKHTGHALPFPQPDAVLAKMLSPLFPDLAERFWAMARHEQVVRDGDGLKIRLQGKGIDYGNYRSGHAFTLDAALGSAHEFGDAEVAAAALRMIDEHCGRTERDGMLYYQASTIANASIAESRMGFRGYWRDAILAGPPEASLRGPILADAPWPGVRVARAVSDGEDLTLVLRPGREPGPQTLQFERLQPGRRYTVTGADTSTLTGDAAGRAALAVELRDRTEIRLAPAA